MVQLTSDVDYEVRRLVGTYGRLVHGIDGVSNQQDLFNAGMTCQATVNVMIALEDRFDFEFPDKMLRRSTFQSMSAIREAVLTLLSDRVPG